MTSLLNIFRHLPRIAMGRIGYGLMCGMLGFLAIVSYSDDAVSLDFGYGIASAISNTSCNSPPGKE